MTKEDLAAYNIAHDIPEDDDGYVTDSELMDINNVLDGNVLLDLSHTGGEFQQIMEKELHHQTWYVHFFLYNSSCSPGVSHSPDVTAPIHKLAGTAPTCTTKD